MKLNFLLLTIAFCCQLTAQTPAGPFRVDIQTSNLTCADSDDGVLRITVVEGPAPALFLLNNLLTGPILQGIVPSSGVPYLINGLAAGSYQITVQDTLGRDTILPFTLNAPPPIVTAVTAYGETCLNEKTGQIVLNNVSGGVPPYLAALNAEVLGTQTSWSGLAYGTHFLRVEDATGCVHTDGVVLPSGIEFNLSAGADTVIFSGDTLQLALSHDQTIVDLQWLPTTDFASSGPADNRFWPVNTTEYTVRATDPNGCQSEDKIVVNVQRRRQIFAPNVLVLNAVEFKNSRFTLYAGGGVAEIERLQVGDRVGRVWFERSHFQTDDPNLGWDGTSGGRLAPAGVYVWLATLRYTDGRTENLQGDVTVVR